MTDFSQAKSWPFQEARALLAHIGKKGKVPGDVVTFETGYGPSGAPHIGTFAEVVRTLWVMKAFDAITDGAYKTRLIMFSDDYDAMRKVPDGLPEWMNDYLGQSLSSIPSPYEFSSATFASDNNSRLCAFVDDILKSYDGSKVGTSPNRHRVSFVSSMEHYTSGKFNAMLGRVWDNYDAIQAVMLPTLGEDRRATYSPFMPVLDHRVFDYGVKLDDEPGYIVFDSMDGAALSIHDGQTKLQWKVDWAMRWVHFDVDYEMSGKDLIDSVKASSKICRILGGTPPLNMTYELFLDKDGAKISKSKGNGFTIEEWLTYGTRNSLMMFLFQNPKQARPLHIELVPKMEDEYIKMRQKEEIIPNDAVWFFKADHSVRYTVPDVSFALLLNLAIVSQVRTADELVRYLEQQRELENAERTFVQLMAHRVIAYAEKQGLYNRETRAATEQELAAFSELADRFSAMMPGMDAEAYQYQVYEVGKRHNFQPLRAWFQALYECFLGSSDGPRFGAFTAAYGLENTIKMLRKANGLDKS